MQEYTPMVDPDPQWWLALDEDERIAAVLEYHRETTGGEVPDEDTHALLHVVVENQVAMGKESPTQAVLRRLIDENLDRHDAIHAIACILANHMYEILHNDNALSNDNYCAALEQLTAKKWLRGEYGSD